MKCSTFLRCCAGPLAFVGSVLGHKHVPVIDPNADWATRHMQGEHHIENFDAGAFFSLHDFDGNGVWDGHEVQKFYGLDDVSNKNLPAAKRLEVLSTIFQLIDKDDNGYITRDEFTEFTRNGGTLPDMDTGPGHHGDAEYEYEIHHWELYHDENTKEEDLIHPEDIAHFKEHDEQEDEQDRIAAMDNFSIVEKNIPQKFLRS